MKGNGRFQILDFLAEPQGQPREPLHKRASRQVVASTCEVQIERSSAFLMLNTARRFVPIISDGV